MDSALGDRREIKTAVEHIVVPVAEPAADANDVAE